MNNDQKTITLAQWCAYLPYDIDIFLDTEGCLRGKCKVSVDNLHLVAATPLYKPLLRPMNKANEGTINEIAELLGYKFSSLFGFSLRDHSKHDDIHIPIDEMPYYIIEKLLAAHYDIFNLIGQGLALPIE